MTEMNQTNISDDVLTAYYDLKRAPITFDFCNFLVAATAQTALMGKKDFDLAIVADAFRNITPREIAYTQVERQWRLWNLIVETTKLLPYIRNLSIIQRPLKQFSTNSYPANYHPTGNNSIVYDKSVLIQVCKKTNLDLRFFRASTYAKRAAEKLVPDTGKKIVVITLRRASHDPQRDSRLDAWIDFIKILEERGFQVVVIPDQDDALGDRTLNRYGWNVIDIAAMSLDIRVAIYERATMNYVTNGGMVDILSYTKVPFMWFSVVVEGSALAQPKYYEQLGMQYGEKYPWLADNQEMIWEPDSLANLAASIDRIK